MALLHEIGIISVHFLGAHERTRQIQWVAYVLIHCACSATTTDFKLNNVQTVKSITFV